MSRNGEFPMTIFYLALYVVCNFDDLSSFRTNSAKRCLSILSGEIAYSAQNSEIDIIHAKYESPKSDPVDTRAGDRSYGGKITGGAHRIAQH